MAKNTGKASATALAEPSLNGSDPAQSAESAIRLEPLQLITAEVPIIGVTPVIPHKWSEKALRMMREKQSGKATRAKKEAKMPEEEAEASTYRLPDGRPGMPATAFKAAIVDSVRFFEGLTMVQAKVSFFVEGVGPDQLVAIESPNEPVLREDTPRNATGVADLRYRYMYEPWSAVLPITFLENMMDLGSLLALVNAAGNGGIGDWRPSAPKSKTGTYGRFRVNLDRPVPTKLVKQ